MTPNIQRGATYVAALALMATVSARAQHPTKMAGEMKRDTTMRMMANPLGVPMDRMGSGTTWIPDAVSLPARHFMTGQWELMLHGFVFVQEDEQGGPRGSSQL